MKGFKKFLKNKNTVTVLGLIAILVILLAAYNMRINQRVSLATVCFAKEPIQPKTLITEEDVARTDMPISYIQGDYYKNCEEVVGKYSNYNTMIAQGSVFYRDLIVEEENLPDAVLHNTNEGERVVSFPVNMETTYGNAIMPGNKIDIYVKLTQDNGKLVYGELLEKVEVLGVKDGEGKNVCEASEETREPEFIYFSLPEAKYLLFSALNYIETNEIEVVIVPNTVKFAEGEVIATEVTSDYLYKFVLDKIEQIDDQKELYNQLLNDMEQEELERKTKNK